ncbi:MAG TPA: MATE family efflux transporter [Thermohalobaculum sp.]|nr:MATE family efflux transporter [Thermohalobaculum sp.]
MAPPAKFTTGSTMRHVAVMTATGAVGLMSLFLVDVANLFYISLLGQAELAAAIGYAGTVQFFMISVSIGLSIAATATVSRAVGAGDGSGARRLAASSMLVLVTTVGLVAGAVWLGRRALLVLLGAEGETLEIASGFLAIVLPSVPILGIAMVTAGLLRSVGDARRAMFVTLSAGVVGATLDPLFIFVFGLGVDGAAIVSVLARVTMAGIGLWGAVRVHDLIGRIDLIAARGDARQLLAIAGPAVATQISTPLGNAYLTRLVSEYGDAAVAGWAVTGRFTALAFAGIFTLSGALGPILGQNLGAGLYPRIRRAYRDALLFAALYVLTAWALLWLGTDFIATAFGLHGAGAEVLRAYTHIGAGGFLFTGALFVSNAAFNNLGRPSWSTGFNWSRDVLAIPVLGFAIGGAFGASSVVAIQALASLLVGTLAALAALRYVDRLSAPPVGRKGFFTPQPAFTSGRAAVATQLGAEDVSSPLAEDEKSR